MAKMVDVSTMWKCETCFHRKNNGCSNKMWCESGEGYRPDYNKLVFIEAEPVKHGKWEHIKRHLWKTDDSGEIDIFALDYEFHNGPECELCGDSFCMHCNPDFDDYECDIGYYKCSECGNKTVHNTNYCPHCGARMDGE